MSNFSTELLNWYRNNKRDLPWRKTTDPYKVWLSEIILQQTRIGQGLAYYNRFVDHYPTVHHLAAASEDEVLRHWQGLGYYSRARNLHHTAQTVVEQYNGTFPNNFSELKKLKGVGDYTAAAIASFCFNEPTPVLDGNVYRFIARLYEIDTGINSNKAKKQFTNILKGLIDKSEPGLFNQAMMEFGSIHCKPRNPGCPSCPFQDNCLAFKNNEVQKYPVKGKKAKVRTRFFNYIVLKHNNKVAIEKRTGNDIWRNLWQFPLIESSSGTGTLPQLMKLLSGTPAIPGEEVEKMQFQYRSGPYQHLLTHQKLVGSFWVFEVPETAFIKSRFKMVHLNKLTTFAFPRLITRFLEQNSKGDIQLQLN